MITIEADIPAKIFPIKQIDKLIKELSTMIRARMIQATPRDSGTAQRSYTPVRRIDGGLSFSGGMGDGPVQRRSLGYSFSNVQPYSHILQTGSQKGKRPWPSVGPRTVEQDGQIYSSQAPGGISSTAQIENFVEKALPQLVKKYLE